MLDVFLGGIAAWFTIPAVVGTLYFVLQLVLMEAGGDMDGDLDFDADFDGDIGHDGGHEFKVLSLQTISAFFMGGGWMGLAAYRLLDQSPTISSLIALGSGVVVGWIFMTLLRIMLKFQASGNIGLDAAVGLEGEVYIEVPEQDQGSGRVTLIIKEHQRRFDAVQEGQVAIPSSTRVRVVRANTASNTVCVERA